MEIDGSIRTWKNVKILPLWYGSSAETCELVAKSGFVYFGKIFDGISSNKNTDEDFFRSGIYFKHSARYASDIYGKGYIFLAWVSMRKPFPIVGDHTKAIKGKEAYKDYNVHYITLISINPSGSYETTYYPTKENETPHYDEIIVFNKSQILPSFWIELEVELPYALSETHQFVNELIPHIIKLLQNPNVDRDRKFRNYLYKELAILLTLEADDYIEEKHKIMYDQLKQIFDSQGGVNKQVSRFLMETQQTSHATPTSSQPNQSTLTTSNNLVSSQPFFHKPLSPTKSSFISKSTAFFASKPKSQAKPFIVFGKADWEKYFGEIEDEPPFPKNIEAILNESCSFWPSKKIKETHLLVLIPNKVKGKPFTLNCLGKLVQKPKSGYATKYDCYTSEAREAIGSKSYPSHWVLITKDVIPGTKGQSYRKACKLVAKHSKKTGIPYELPHELGRYRKHIGALC